MNCRKSLILAIVFGLSVVLLAGPAGAWEFKMDGAFTWLYEYRGQMGKQGFFGAYDQAQTDGIVGTAGRFAPYNFYMGGYHQVQSVVGGVPNIWAAAYGGQGSSLAGGESIVSGSDASWQICSMSTNIEIRMNKALRIRGNYFVGSWNSPNYSTSQGLMVSSGYLTEDAPGVQRSFSPGYWRTLWLTAQLPWGQITMGKRPANLGMGLQYDGTDNRSTDSIALTVPYGPFRFQGSIRSSRRGYPSDDYAAASAWYNERPDKNNTRVYHFTFPRITYRSGPLEMGISSTWHFRHRGREGVIDIPATRAAATSNSNDFAEQWGAAWFKYNNGRFFINSEYDYRRINDRRNYGRNFTNATGFANTNPAYTVHDSGAVEVGALCGPSKVSLIGAWFSGDDYRGGWLGANRRMVRVTSGLQSDTWSNYSVFRPYSYLMVYGYGLGGSFARDTGNGFVQDATLYGARLDYAVAANLNIFGSFAWAERFSHSGYLWGCLRPAVGTTAAGVDTVTTTAPGLGGASATTVAGAPYAGQVAFTNSSSTGGTLTPTIPDGALGYEFDAGFDWKLLEGFTAKCTFGYWVPGKWFSYACADKSVPNWGSYSSTAAVNFGTIPGKTIDPVFGTEFKLEGSF